MHKDEFEDENVMFVVEKKIKSLFNTTSAPTSGNCARQILFIKFTFSR